MIKIDKINFEKSIKNKMLIFKEDWYLIFDKFFIVVYLSGISFMFSFIIVKEEKKEYLILLLPIAFVLFGVYRKITEKKLSTICFRKSTEEKRQIVEDFCTQKKFEIQLSSNKVVILKEQHGFGNYHRSYVFLLDDEAFYYCTLRDNFRTNFPSIWSHYFVKRDFMKFLKLRA
ncbi:hypothetical protein [Flavobacterium flavigenum]|uniref:hypothetical protein n=1 Tax=Flavobacterium flavigenum TaxID=3003258 RepID=UPI0022AC6309|nr:hypothetical protein [Flavobacterium flavigenum]